MINSFDRWCADMAGMKRHICKKRKEDTESARDVRIKPRKVRKFRETSRKERKTHE